MALGHHFTQLPRAVSGKFWEDIDRKLRGWLCPWLGAEGDLSVQKPHSVWLLAAETGNRVWVGTVEDQVPWTWVRNGLAREAMQSLLD